MLRKVLRLSVLSKFDVSNVSFFDVNRAIYRSKNSKMFKCLMSSVCKFDCSYCCNPWRRGETLKPEEFSKVFIDMYKKGIADSVFISSAIYSDPERVMEDIIKAGELIRKEFSGYMHLKIIPGANRDQIKRAAEIADRISINAEVPRADMLSEVCSVKSRYDVERRERWISKFSKKYGITHTTQLVVGIGETDLDVLNFAEKWYGFGVRRIYFSPFRALKGTPFEGRKNESKKRVVNLYKADWLIREYGYDLEKLKAVLNENGMFECDPKILVARKFGCKNYMEIPGVGFKTAKLLENHSLLELKKMGVNIKKISAFCPEQKKLSLWL